MLDEWTSWKPWAWQIWLINLASAFTVLNVKWYFWPAARVCGWAKAVQLKITIGNFFPEREKWEKFIKCLGKWLSLDRRHWYKRVLCYTKITNINGETLHDQKQHLVISCYQKWCVKLKRLKRQGVTVTHSDPVARVKIKMIYTNLWYLTYF